jgi:DNA-binding SARP family transcriptional activator
MLCHQQLGDHSEALLAYRRCRELLARFLGIPPNAKTQALFHSVRERAVCVPVGNGAASAY